MNSIPTGKPMASFVTLTGGSNLQATAKKLIKDQQPVDSGEPKGVMAKAANWVKEKAIATKDWVMLRDVEQKKIGIPERVVRALILAPAKLFLAAIAGSMCSPGNLACAPWTGWCCILALASLCAGAQSGGSGEGAATVAGGFVAAGLAPQATVQAPALGLAYSAYNDFKRAWHGTTTGEAMGGTKKSGTDNLLQKGAVAEGLMKPEQEALEEKFFPENEDKKVT